MRYCKPCKDQFELKAVAEKEISVDDLNGFGCELCAFAMPDRVYFEAWHFIGDIIAREVGKPEIKAQTQIELTKTENETRKLDQEDRRLDQKDKELEILSNNKSSSASG